MGVATYMGMGWLRVLRAGHGEGLADNGIIFLTTSLPDSAASTMSMGGTQIVMVNRTCKVRCCRPCATASRLRWWQDARAKQRAGVVFGNPAPSAASLQH